MVTVIKRGSSKEVIAKRLKELDKKKVKGFKAKQFCGILKLEEDALVVQKQMRDEW